MFSPSNTRFAENLAFIIRERDAAYGREIAPDDIFVTMLSWVGYNKGLDTGTLAVMVRTMKITKILQIRVAPKEDVLEKLSKEVDKMLLKALLTV
jgi:hypothetical protein